MGYVRRYLRFIFFWVVVLLSARVASAETLAFPGAEGFGAYAQGGRGGTVVSVTNLRDYLPEEELPIPGSLRAACEMKGPRIVIFRVSGTIELKAHLDITEPYITIAGQTAPGDGICLKNFGTRVLTRQVVVRYLRFRPGDEVGRMLTGDVQNADRSGIFHLIRLTQYILGMGGYWQTNALRIASPAKGVWLSFRRWLVENLTRSRYSVYGDAPIANIIVDHCSMSWGNKQVLGIQEAVDSLTVQWCIISESLARSTHPKGAHGFGALISTNGAVSFHHNLLAHHMDRAPYLENAASGHYRVQTADVRNNVIYGCRSKAGRRIRLNYVGNHGLLGAKLTAWQTPACSIYAAGNKDIEIEGGISVTLPFNTPTIRTHEADEVWDVVLANAGATLPLRDAVDRRIVAEARAGLTRLIDTPSDVDGWPELRAAPAPTDTDADGMPDAWEREYGLESESADGNGDRDDDGYTNIEEYLNHTDPTQR